MTLADAYETNRAEIAAGVRAAAEAQALSLATTLQVRDNGSLTLRQIASPVCAGTVTLTASQVAYLVDRIAAGVRAHGG